MKNFHPYKMPAQLLIAVARNGPNCTSLPALTHPAYVPLAPGYAYNGTREVMEYLR